MLIICKLDENCLNRNRVTQVPDLIRMCQTLMNVRDILWIVSEEDKGSINPDANLTVTKCKVPST